ncbi:MAG: YceI family protein [Chitinophagales bacterium]
MSKKTIAIIGATGNIGSVLSKRLAKSNFRLLLFDHNTKKLTSLVNEIKNASPSAEIEFMSCAGDASWEADIIIPDIPAGEEKELAEKIIQFTNRKIVLLISNGKETEDMQKLLPGAKVIKVSGRFNFIENPDRVNEELLIEGTDDEALETAKEIIKGAGFKPVSLKEFKSKQINQSKINTMETTKWILDPTHSEIHFKVRHLMVSWVTGSFKQFDASVETEGEDIKTAKVEFTAEINSISTNNDQRDAHLRTGDFFDAENHPRLIFKSEKLEKIDDENYKLYGMLSMRGNSKKIVLNVEYGGMTKDPWGNTRTGFSVSGKINRKDFGVSFSMVSETGGILLGEDVSISANVEFVKQVAVQTKAA